MARAIILLMDSFGIGASLDAEKYGDAGADTLGHIAQQCELKLPNLFRLGLFHAHLSSTGVRLPGIDYQVQPRGLFGYAVEQSLGKDTPSGHWEIAGVPVLFDWGYFRQLENSFPPELIDAFIQQACMVSRNRDQR